jgi:hypothetical protein
MHLNLVKKEVTLNRIFKFTQTMLVLLVLAPVSNYVHLHLLHAIAIFHFVAHLKALHQKESKSFNYRQHLYTLKCLRLQVLGDNNEGGHIHFGSEYQQFLSNNEMGAMWGVEKRSLPDSLQLLDTVEIM